MKGVRGPGESRDTAMAVEQDMFDAVVMADERFHGEGYQEGYEEGSSLGIIEGKQYGMLHGAKIGSEIGCYRGFALAWKCLLHNGASEKDRKMKVVEALIELLQGFPYDDPTYEKLHEDLDRIRAVLTAQRASGLQGDCRRLWTHILRTHRRADVCTLSVTVIKGKLERHPLFCGRSSSASSLSLCLGSLQRSDHSASCTGAALSRDCLPLDRVCGPG
ncbi:protein LTO1 homolog isoform X2 [Mastomys coucha]|uniref:protein LTO1 homolog isoform X2 n=1 Tax=Mastomys coucha TaxID=35658 RepID=UPI001261C89D|nr:protein LTO1 homolog isoform X2 [Mastomys coucha]